MRYMFAFFFPFRLGLTRRMSSIVAYIQEQLVVGLLTTFMFLKYINATDSHIMSSEMCSTLTSRVPHSNDTNYHIHFCSLIDEMEQSYFQVNIIYTFIRWIDVSVIATVACLGSAMW